MDLTKLKQKRFYGKARIQFLAYRQSIAAAIEEGYPLSVLWQTMHEDGLFDAKYDQFVEYVNTFIREKKSRPPRPDSRPELKPSGNAPKTPGLPANAQHADPAESKSDMKADGTEGPRMLGGYKMDPNRPKRAPVEMPKPFEWNPIPLTEEEIRTGKITSR